MFSEAAQYIQYYFLLFEFPPAYRDHFTLYVLQNVRSRYLSFYFARFANGSLFRIYFLEGISVFLFLLYVLPMCFIFCKEQVPFLNS